MKKGYNEAHCCDGIDINGCRFAEIRNCDIETGDDAICLKNTERENPGAKRAPMYDIPIPNSKGCKENRFLYNPSDCRKSRSTTSKDKDLEIV